jgi:hypothetical protein
LREWAKYRYGVFPEVGFDNDPRYPSVYREGNATLTTEGCAQRDPFCPVDAAYDRFAPTKQTILCHGASALETILNSADFKPKQQVPILFICFWKTGYPQMLDTFLFKRNMYKFI